MAFVHLHTHSEYSLLDGANRIPELVAHVKQLGMDSLAVTDHGNLHAAWSFYEEAKAQKLRPILGFEAYLAFGPRTAREKPSWAPSAYSHLVLLAKNRAGYKNLVRLSSIGFLEGFYRRPRIDKEVLARYSEGIVCLAACLSGEVAISLRQGRYDEAKKSAEWFAQTFGRDNFWLEIQHHGIPEELAVTAGMLQLSKDLGLGVVATNDAHYLRKEDAESHDVLLAIGTGSDLDDPKRFRFTGSESYVKSEAEMRALFPAHPETIDNTQLVADRCEFDFEKRYFLPGFPRPAEFATDEALLLDLAVAGAKGRYGDPLPPEVQQRLDYELSVINTAGYAGYFLIVQDFIRAARDRGIPVGPGRGSAAGSLVAYALGITNVCPLKFDLLFERFLNPERVSMPDIDVDFCFERRGEVIEYVRERYGRASVGQIVTFGTMKARAAVKDVARVLRIPPGEADKLTKLIPSGPAYALTIPEAMQKVDELKDAVKGNADYQRLMALSSRIEGISRHMSVHAAGVVIAPGPLQEYIPVCTAPTKGAGAAAGGEDAIITQYEMGPLEKVGMLKMDLLGLKTLTVIHDAVEMIAQRRGERIDMDALSFDDPKVYELLRQGRTAGIFQFESALATETLRAMKCDRFDDLVASNALLRPGPLDAGMHTVFIKRKLGQERVTYPHPLLKEILEPTYGVITYQEQVMRIANVLGGFSLAEADVLRKAVGKKDAELIKKELGRFVERAMAQGHPRKLIEELAAQIETFGRYGFNKCVVGSTEILDASTGRLVRIEDLYRGTATLGAVTTCDTESLRLRSGRVVDVVDNGIKQVYRLRTESGREIEATANHPLLTVEGWRPLGELAAGEHVAVPRMLPVEGSVEWPEHEVVALGHLLVEGNLCHPSGVYFYNQDPAELGEFRTAAERFPNVACTTGLHHGTGSVYTKRVDRRTPNGIFEWARRLGLLGKTATEKEVPAEAFTLTNAQLGMLLSRMWAGDGHINRADRNVYYATSSKRLAHQVQHLLLRLGVVGRIRQVEFPYRGSSRTGYQVFVTGNGNLRAFCAGVASHFLSEERRESVACLVVESAGRSSKDVVPVRVRRLVRAAKARAGITWADLEATAGVSSRDFTPAGTGPHKIGFTRTTVGRLADYFGDAELQRLAASDVLWDRITAIEFIGEMRTYDLEVADTHNFVANDIIVHNSHSVAYSVLSYQTAWLKAHYPAEFMAALLSSEIGSTDKVVQYINEARELGLEILPPDVNESGFKFTVVGDQRIRFGLGAVRNVGEGAIASIIAGREREPYQTLRDFVERIDLRLCNKRVLESLVAAGACDGLGGHRKQLIEGLDGAFGEAQLKQQEREAGQESLFGEAAPAAAPKHTALPDVPPWTEAERLAKEKEVIGFFISGHPLERFRDEVELFGTRTTATLHEWSEHQVTIAAVVTAVKRQISKKTGKEYARLVLEDFHGTAEAIVFPEAWAKLNQTIFPDASLLLTGGYSERDRGEDRAPFIVEGARGLAELKGSGAVGLSLRWRRPTAPDQDTVRAAVRLCNARPGPVSVYIEWSDGNGEAVRLRARRLRVAADEDLVRALRDLLGADSVHFVKAG